MTTRTPKLTETETDVLDSLATAIRDDPHPQAGRTYFPSDGAEYHAARRLVDLELAFVVSGTFGAEVHVAPSDSGLERN